MPHSKEYSANKLFKGVRNFGANDFINHKKLFEKLEKKQNPHTLFIGCSDSRVVPNLITNSLPGELFIIRNIANIVPYFKEHHSTYVASSSAIEYALKVLEVNNIIVCGHSNCGGCKALYQEKLIEQLPLTKKWLELTGNIKEQVKLKIENKEIKVAERDVLTEQMNIVEQMNHLLSFPYIKSRFENGDLSIMGWYYIIQTGEVLNYSPENEMFEKIK